MKSLRISPPCVTAHDRETGAVVSGLALQAKSGDSVPNAGEQVAYFLMHHAQTERMAHALAGAIYIHWTADGLPDSSFEFQITK